jgi:hypothetical protein
MDIYFGFHRMGWNNNTLIEFNILFRRTEHPITRPDRQLKSLPSPFTIVTAPVRTAIKNHGPTESIPIIHDFATMVHGILHWHKKIGNILML